MNDTIGVIGQKYIDRKSNKVGVLLDRDVENKKLSFLDEKAEPFQVSFAAFKSNWRKVIVDVPKEEVEPADEFAEFEVEPTSSYRDVVKAEPTEEPSVTVIKPAVLDTEDKKIKNFVDTLTGCRVASVDIIDGDATVMVDDIIVCAMHRVEGGYRMSMLPDIFIFAEWHNTFTAGDVHFNIKHGRHAGVLVDCVKASLGDILQFIKTAAVEINLYGYMD